MSVSDNFVVVDPQNFGTTTDASTGVGLSTANTWTDDQGNVWGGDVNNGSPEYTWVTRASDSLTSPGYSLGDTFINVGDKSINLNSLLSLLLKAYLPVDIEGEKVKMVRVSDLLERDGALAKV